MEEQNNDDCFLKLIPAEKLSIREKEVQLRFIGFLTNLYKFPSKPKGLDHVNWPTDDTLFVIWRDNETLICIYTSPFITFEMMDRSISFSLLDVGQASELKCAIYGATDAAVAETAAFFWSLEHSASPYASLRVDHHPGFWTGDQNATFDFASFSSEQFSRILDANPTRKLLLQTGTWSREQSFCLASRPNPVKVMLADVFDFQDKGTAFVSALEEREHSFGSLELATDRSTFTPDNLRRLFNLEKKFEKLKISKLDEELVLRPFSANVDTLEYHLAAEHIQPDDFHSLHIVTENLKLTLRLGEADDLGGLLSSLFHRVAELKHFKQFALSLVGRVPQIDATSAVQALIRAIKSNPELTHLDLSYTELLYVMGPHFEELFNALGEHESLRVITLHPFPPVDISEVDDYEASCQPYYSALGDLLSRNLNIQVVDDRGDKVTDGTTIEKIYWQSFICKISTRITDDSESMRLALVATIILQMAQLPASSFMHISHFLTFHNGSLCDFFLGTLADREIVEPLYDAPH
jgi:hypothetical protein